MALASFEGLSKRTATGFNNLFIDCQTAMNNSSFGCLVKSTLVYETSHSHETFQIDLTHGNRVTDAEMDKHLRVQDANHSNDLVVHNNVGAHSREESFVNTGIGVKGIAGRANTKFHHDKVHHTVQFFKPSLDIAV